MPVPFVGRTRELRELRRLLVAGRNVVIAGAFGSGRTTLVRHLACSLEPHTRFVFADLSQTRRAIRRSLTEAFGSHRHGDSRVLGCIVPSRVVLVLDDVVRVTSQRAGFIREILSDQRVEIILIADRTLKDDALLRVRAILGSAPVLHVGALSESEVERYVSRRIEGASLKWSRSDIRAIARSTHGYPLGMRMTVDAALRRTDMTARQ